MSTFVTVGNALQPFARLLNEVARLAEAGYLSQPVVVQHGHTPFSSAACTAVPFLELHEFEAEVNKAEVCIIHAGAGSALYALRTGKVPVIMPRMAAHREHIDNHQDELAGTLERAGVAVVARSASDLKHAIERARCMQAERRSHLHATEPKLVGMVRDVLAEWDREQQAKLIRCSAS